MVKVGLVMESLLVQIEKNFLDENEGKNQGWLSARVESQNQRGGPLKLRDYQKGLSSSLYALFFFWFVLMLLTEYTPVLVYRRILCITMYACPGLI